MGKFIKTLIGIDSCLRTGHTLASVFLSLGILSFTTVNVLALPKDTVVTTIGTGSEFVGAVCVSPDSKFLYGTNNDNQTVMVINTTANRVTAKISVGNVPYGIAISPDGGTLYVSNAQDGTVSVISTARRTVTTTVTVGNYPEYLAASPDGQYVYVPNLNDSTVSIIDTATNSVSTTIVVPYRAHEAGFSQNALTAYVSSTGLPKKFGGKALPQCF